jgi:hypothetical protein
MTEYSRMAKGSFTAVGTSAIVNLPFQPDFVEIWNYSIIKTAAANKVAHAWWDNKLQDGSNNPTMVEIYNNASAVVFDTIQTNGISAFQAGQLLQYGPTKQIIGATAANPVVFNVTAHGYQVGDTVVFEGLYQTQFTAGMAQMSNIQFTISVVGDADHFTVKWDGSGSNYTALSASPSGATVKKVLYPFLYVPQVSVISAITLGATTTIVTTDYHNFEVGQQVAFRIPNVAAVPALSPPAWGTTQLNSLPNLLTPGAPNYGYVVSVTDNWTFVVNINSSAYTAFNVNIPIVNVPGLSFPQVLSVGDVNTGGNIISAGSPLYPSPQFPTSTNRVPTINGPAIRGAFVNNTSQGFVIGSGAAAADVSAAVTMIANTNIVYWHAYLHDLSLP